MTNSKQNKPKWKQEKYQKSFVSIFTSSQSTPGTCIVMGMSVIYKVKIKDIRKQESTKKGKKLRNKSMTQSPNTFPLLACLLIVVAVQLEVI